jgi:type I restriction-modification system DNA methylase subunit
MKQQKPVNAFADFRKLFEQLSYRHSYADTFTHFLDFALFMLDPHRDRTHVEYLENIYTEKEAPLMCNLFEAWAEASDNNGEGFHDVLGELFMEFVSHGRNGQFFTPQPVCDMMALMTIGENLQDGETINDPACGSGRTLMAAAKINRRALFYGADSDLTCCKMTALNMIINTMQGEVAHMNSLSLEYFKSYHIKVYNMDGKMIPFYYVSNNPQRSIFTSI